MKLDPTGPPDWAKDWFLIILAFAAGCILALILRA